MSAAPKTRAEAEFDITRPLRLSRSAITPRREGDTVFIYSRAVDGMNSFAVASVCIANVVGLNDEQVGALTDRIADEIVAPGFSDEEIEDIAYEFASARMELRVQLSGIAVDTFYVTDADRHRARTLCANLTERRRLNLSGVR